MPLSKNNVIKMQRVRVSVLCGHGGVGGKGGTPCRPALNQHNRRGRSSLSVKNTENIEYYERRRTYISMVGISLYSRFVSRLISIPVAPSSSCPAGAAAAAAVFRTSSTSCIPASRSIANTGMRTFASTRMAGKLVWSGMLERR